MFLSRVGEEAFQTLQVSSSCVHLSSFKDMLVPIADLKASLECFHQEVEIYPIWLCPFKLPNNPGMLKTQMHKGENGSRENETM